MYGSGAKPSRPGIVTLLTDFGLRDSYVAQMKAIMLSVDPGIRLVDITHEVPPQDILEGSFQLASAFNHFPAGTVHLAVIDPGVGTARRPVAFSFQGYQFVMPDNGLCSLTLNHHDPDELVVLDPAAGWRPTISPTFHGRDLFAPVAARLAAGWRLSELGSATSTGTLERLAVSGAVRDGERVRGPVVSIDRFGTCRTLIRPEDLPWDDEAIVVRCGSLEVHGLSRTYGDVSPGTSLALFGSHGGLELSIRDGDAARIWEIVRGAIVEVAPAGDSGQHNA